MEKKLSGMLAVMMGAALLWTNLSPTLATSTVAGTINVIGEAEVRVVPDEVMITLGVETSHRELSVAMRRNDDRVTEVIQMAKRLGVESRHIQTDYINIEPIYEDYYAEPRILEGYIVRKTVVIRLQQVGQFESLITSLIEAGITSVRGIQFRTTELRKYRDQARELATKAAMEKAEDMASVLGMEVGRATSVNENHSGWYSWYSYSWWGYRGQAMSQNVVVNIDDLPADLEGSFAPGQISVTAQVSASFELRD